MNGETPISDLANYFINDNVHLNKKGYDKWVNMIKETIGLQKGTLYEKIKNIISIISCNGSLLLQ